MSDDPPDEDDSRDDAPGRESPFDRLDADVEREGDPFERLDDEPAERQGRPPADGAWGPPGEDRRDTATDGDRPNPASPDAESTGANAADAGPAVTPDRSADPAPSDDPFADVQTPTENPFDGADSVFERVDSGSADPDQVWASLTGEDDDDEEAEPSIPDEGRYSDVSKHGFCEQCEHFSPPPDVSCGHHTAEIIEFLDMETVRLLDCPVVAERQELERRE